MCYDWPQCTPAIILGIMYVGRTPSSARDPDPAGRAADEHLVPRLCVGAINRPRRQFQNTLAAPAHRPDPEGHEVLDQTDNTRQSASR